MSVKIYNGFRFKKKYSFNELHRIFMDFRVQANSLKIQGLANHFSKECSNLLDDRAVGLSESEGTIENVVYRQCLAGAADLKKGYRNTDIDYGCDIVVMPLRSRLLGMVFSEENSIYDAWYSLDCVEDYRYWNNNDHPQVVSSRRWYKRERDWGCLSRQGVPAYLGMTAKITGDELYFPEFKDMRFPSFKCRVVRLAKRLQVAELTKSLCVDSKDAYMASIGKYMRGLDELRAFWKTSEGLKSLAVVRASVEKKLIKRIRKEHICG